MRFHVLTLFPQAFRSPIEHGRLGRAISQELLSVQITDIRAYTHDSHSSADDYQFGGGSGMVLKPEPIFEAAEDVLSGYSEDQRSQIPIILLSPQGEVLNQEMARELANYPALVLICGHYSGVDERVRQNLATREVSIGDYVLTGGELAALVLMDVVARFAPGVVGSTDNVEGDSITSGLLQHPLYTRPAEYRGMAVPEILLSGHHAQIDLWRRRQALSRTLTLRPDLLARADLSHTDLDYLQSLGYQRDGK
jgi:tRNA (guanine37-N1)-methyltransferase